MKLNIKDKDKMFKYGGWLLSFLTIAIGASFLWPHFHVALLGFALIYLGVRIFNFQPLKNIKRNE